MPRLEQLERYVPGVCACIYDTETRYVYTAEFSPIVTGLVFLRIFRLFLGQCALPASLPFIAFTDNISGIDGSCKWSIDRVKCTHFSLSLHRFLGDLPCRLGWAGLEYENPVLH